jgi:hypothetical protein
MSSLSFARPRMAWNPLARECKPGRLSGRLVGSDPREGRNHAFYLDRDLADYSSSTPPRGAGAVAA